MKQTIAAVVAALAIAASATAGGFWLHENYTILGTSLISNEEIEKINLFGQMNAMAGYMKGLEEGGQTCKSHT